MIRPIAPSLSPNLEKDDILLALKLLFSPIRWMNFRDTENFENKFSELFGKDYKALAVNSGRSALYLIIKTMGIGEGDEVAIQALTCVNVPNAILWLKATPIYVDVDVNLNMDPEDLEGKLGKKVKAIIIQHTFGVPANLEKIKKIAEKKHILVIEDCAVALGAKYKKRQVGTYGDIAFFSFGRDKVISSVFGGLILCKSQKVYEKLKKERDSLNYPTPLWVLQQLLHPILFAVILPLYNFGIGKLTVGKILLFLAQKIGLVSKPIYTAEKSGARPKVFPTKMPGVLSVLALNQLSKLEKFNLRRRRIEKLYRMGLSNSGLNYPQVSEGSIWLRVPIVDTRATEILALFKKNRIILGDWYKKVVVPVNNLDLVNYRYGSCPRAEKIAGNVINLPTYPTLKLSDAKRVITLLTSI